MNSHKAGCICVECESQLRREVAQLRQQRDELAAALGTFSLLAQRIDTQRGIICRLTNDRDIMTACEVIAEHLNTAADSASDPTAGLREHDEWVTAEKDREIEELKQSDELLQQTINSMSAEIQSWHNRLAAIDKRNHEQLAAYQSRAKAADADAMIAHRWFAEQFGEIMNGRDFAVKVPMATGELAGLKQQLAAPQLREKKVDAEIQDLLAAIRTKPSEAVEVLRPWLIGLSQILTTDTAALSAAYIAERTKELRESSTLIKPGERHSYISTACQHALHERCRLSCKFCTAPCQCVCHSRKQEAAPDA